VLRLHGVASSAACNIGSKFDVLVEVADMAAHFLPRLQREGYDWDEAECEPLPSLVYAARDVTAVLALHRHIFVAFQRRCEGCFMS